MAMPTTHHRSTCSRHDALTFVLRSTHSSQLSVGLLRFCFFLGRASPCNVLTDVSGLVDGCIPSSSIVEAAAGDDRTRVCSVQVFFTMRQETGRRGVHVTRKASCKMAGISEDDVVSRQEPQKRVCVAWGCGDGQPPLGTRSSRVWNNCICYVSRLLHIKISQIEGMEKRGHRVMTVGFAYLVTLALDIGMTAS
jgi:hypothetical protein